MTLFGLGLVTAFYVLISLQFYSVVFVMAPLLKRRFGTELGLLWMCVGLALCYNIIYNHFLAMIIRPGSVKDLKMIEKMRQQ